MLTSIALLGGFDKYPRPAAFSADGSRFVIAGSNGRLAIVSRDGEILADIVVPRGGILDPSVLSVAFSPDDVHVAAVENGIVRVRRAADLGVVAERDRTGNGEVAFCDGGRVLVLASTVRSVCFYSVPSLDERGAVSLDPGGYDSYDLDNLVADPTGGFVAVSDNGGYSENEIGSTIAHGSPSVTILTADASIVRTIEVGRPAYQLELDRWRQRLLVVAYTGIGVWNLAGTEQTMFTPYEDREKTLSVARVAAARIAVCEPWVATVPETNFTSLSLDIWEPTTYRKLATSTALSHAPRWLAASPDGSRLVTPEPNGIRVWACSASFA